VGSAYRKPDNDSLKPEIKAIVGLREINFTCEISGSHGSEYEDVFWDAAPCSLVEIDRCFTSVYCVHHQGDRDIFDTKMST
jgi:hypothetical protein